MGYFIFNGKDSRDFGILESVPIPPKAERTLQTVEIPGRMFPLNRVKEEFKNVQLSFVLGITDHSKINDINKWLNGSGRLILSSDTSKYYNAFIHSFISPERLSVRFGKVPIIFTVEPFRYDVDNPVISNVFTDIKDSQPEKTITVTVGGSYKCEPLYFFRWAGRIEITVNGGEPLYIDSGKENGVYTETAIHNSGGVLKYECPESTIFIDTALRIAYRLENSVKKICCEKTSGKFPMFEPGENIIKFRIATPDDWKYTTSDGRTLTYRYTEQTLSAFDITPNTRWL